jgi:REP element-mobilizing transposase RayT
VTARGNARADIVYDDTDRQAFVDVLGRVVTVSRWRLHAWVLMTNHYHLLLETPEPNLARGMRQLNGTYSQGLNRRHDRVGHVFQGRYKGVLVERESHLLELVRYVVLNPVRARLCRQPRDHRWSSYSETAGLRGVADWLEVDWTLSQFGVQPSRARRRFREFVAEGRGVDYRPWDELSGQIYLGSAAFQERMTKLIAGAKPGAEIPRRQRRPARPDLATVEREVLSAFGASPGVLEGRSRHPARKAFALLARRVADAPLGAISSRMRLSSRGSGTTVRSAAEFEQKDRRFRRLVAEVEKRLR